MELDEFISNYGAISLFLFVGLCGLLICARSMRNMLASNAYTSKAAQSRTMQGAAGAKLESLFTPRNDTNTFTRAEAIRDAACARLVERAKASGIRVIEQRSQAHSPNVWFRLDYVLPSTSQELHLCASVTVEVERMDFHRFEHILTVIAQVGAQVKKVDGIISLDERAVEAIHDFIVTPGKKLRLNNRIRQWSLQFWRPVNKVERLREDWVTGFIIVPVLLGVALTPVTLGISFLISLGSVIFLAIRSSKMRTYVLTSGKPFTDPRALRWMDSWQASIFGLGAQAPMVQEGILERLRSGELHGGTIVVERIGYWGTDSWVEREQIVVSHRRAIGFVHIVPYGDVLYVAWESHLNFASWIEQPLAAGIDRVTGHNVVANRVVAGLHAVNEYDVTDSNFLSEWLHEAVKREVKLRMAENKIDQEIDFTVQRESRIEALTESADKEKKDSKANSEERAKSTRFKRIG